MTGQESARTGGAETARWTCDACGKTAYASRKRARDAARRMGHGRAVYVCELAPSWAADRWHVGNSPPQLKAGTISRAQVSSRSTRRL